MSNQQTRGNTVEPRYPPDAVSAMNSGKKSGTSAIQHPSTFKTEGLKPDFTRKINPEQHMKLIHHFSESTRNSIPQVSEANGVKVKHIRVNVEYGVIHISTYKNGDNIDYEISMFVVGDLLSSEKWFSKVLDLNGVMTH